MRVHKYVSLNLVRMIYIWQNQTEDSINPRRLSTEAITLYLYWLIDKRKVTTRNQTVSDDSTDGPTTTGFRFSFQTAGHRLAFKTRMRIQRLLFYCAVSVVPLEPLCMVTRQRRATSMLRSEMPRQVCRVTRRES